MIEITLHGPRGLVHYQVTHDELMRAQRDIEAVIRKAAEAMAVADQQLENVCSESNNNGYFDELDRRGHVRT